MMEDIIGGAKTIDMVVKAAEWKDNTNESIKNTYFK